MTTTQVSIGLGEIECLQGEGNLVCMGVGSCVALILMEPGARVGAIAHIMLPATSETTAGERPARFADTAVPATFELVERLGARRENIRAALFGGASVMQRQVTNLMMEFGPKTVQAIREALETLSVPIVAAETGGNVGRTVSLDIKSGFLTLRTPGTSDRLVHRFTVQ